MPGVSNGLPPGLEICNPSRANHPDNEHNVAYGAFHQRWGQRMRKLAGVQLKITEWDGKKKVCGFGSEYRAEVARVSRSVSTT